MVALWRQKGLSQDDNYTHKRIKYSTNWLYQPQTRRLRVTMQHKSSTALIWRDNIFIISIACWTERVFRSSVFFHSGIFLLYINPGQLALQAYRGAIQYHIQCHTVIDGPHHTNQDSTQAHLWHCCVRTRFNLTCYSVALASCCSGSRFCVILVTILAFNKVHPNAKNVSLDAILVAILSFPWQSTLNVDFLAFEIIYSFWPYESVTKRDVSTFPLMLARSLKFFVTQKYSAYQATCSLTGTVARALMQLRIVPQL